MRITFLTVMILVLGACQTTQRTAATPEQCEKIATSFISAKDKAANLPGALSSVDIDKVSNGVLRMYNAKCDLAAIGIKNVRVNAGQLKGYDILSDKFPSPIKISL